MPASASAGVRRVGFRARNRPSAPLRRPPASAPIATGVAARRGCPGGASSIGSLGLMGSISLRRRTARQMSSATCESAQRSRLDVEVGGTSGIAPRPTTFRSRCGSRSRRSPASCCAARHAAVQRPRRIDDGSVPARSPRSRRPCREASPASRVTARRRETRPAPHQASRRTSAAAPRAGETTA